MYINPYQNLENAAWRKTNFHTHSGTGPNTCGKHSPEEVIAMYRESKYDFLCLSNHNLYRNFSNYSDEQLTLIDGVEYTSALHMLNIGVQESYLPDDYQTAIDKTNAFGGFTILCHPNWPDKNTFSSEKMLALKGYMGLEVMNYVCYRLRGSGRATGVWDELLTAGVLATGFADDDFHSMSDGCNYFNLIACEEKTYESMKKAIDANAVCASTGLYPVYHKLEGDALKVKAALPIPTYLENYVYTFVGPNGKILSEQTGVEASYTLKGEAYVRVEVRSEAGHYIMFQPVYQEGTLKRA